MNGTVQERQNRQGIDQQGTGKSMQNTIAPSVNIYGRKDEYLLEVEMPGVTKEGLQIMVEGNELTIIGRPNSEAMPGSPLYQERPTGEYRRVFEMGNDIDTAGIRAEIHQGILRLHLPITERVKPRKIEITE
jgi:HSP20 family protein